MLEQRGNWDDDLLLIEFTHNNNFHYSIVMAPFEALYVRENLSVEASPLRVED